MMTSPPSPKPNTTLLTLPYPTLPHSPTLNSFLFLLFLLSTHLTFLFLLSYNYCFTPLPSLSLSPFSFFFSFSSYSLPLSLSLHNYHGQCEWERRCQRFSLRDRRRRRRRRRRSCCFCTYSRCRRLHVRQPWLSCASFRYDGSFSPC